MSTVTNIIDIFLKCVVKFLPDTIVNTHYWTHIKNKDIRRCLILCVPVFGNIRIAAIDRRNLIKQAANFSNAVTKLGPKFNALPVAEIKPFTPLTDQQLTNLLDTVAELKEIDAAQNSMKAYVAIQNIHKNGLSHLAQVGISGGQQLKTQMQSVIAMIFNTADSKKQKELLLDLAHCLEDCVPVTRRSVEAFCEKLNGCGSFEKELTAFVASLKDEAFNQAIYECFPEMTNPEYAALNHYTPSMQFPHTKNKLLLEIGQELGFPQIPDPNARRKFNAIQLDNIKKAYLSKLSPEMLIREFIIQINGNHPLFFSATAHKVEVV